ncbi:hypothetical protein HMPREF0975_01138 [Actinomyces sp. oral taxon 849 str. F0330]|uniref:alpha/beta fold hydrolase n=1 Tax=Actinomyces sp. oral taxon 849 TaxID=653385 RepID=UPI000242FB87|nr:alpha/beta fold hydrolase [Actinomyces sp. oral taxon 849]EHM94773.1 hypothetical protein HMPREF0975_01138 [Actinomyces sp. oral taxon 849 str. F0330]
MEQLAIPSGNYHIPATLDNVSSRILVLSHGIFVDRKENGRFERLSVQLKSRGISSLAIDLPGHGKNPIPSMQANVSNMTWSLIDTVNWAAQHYESVGLVASSFSGALASLAWPLIRESINDLLIFLNPVLDFDSTFVNPLCSEMGSLFNTSTFQQARDQGYFQPVQHFTMSRDTLLDFRTISVSTAYSQISYPHTIFHGDADELVPFSVTKNIAVTNPFCDWRTISGGVHAFTQSGHEEQVWSEISRLA